MDKFVSYTDGDLDELPVSKEIVEMFQNRLGSCQRDCASLARNLEVLKLNVEEGRKLESNYDSLEEKLKFTNSVLSRTQALLLTERNNCQQLALHVDLLKKQHEMDREKLNLLLSLNGKPVPSHLFQGELILRQQLEKMERLMKEQSSRLLEERSLMKAEWDKERHLNEKLKKELRQRIQNLQDQIMATSEHKILQNQKRVKEFFSVKPFVEDTHDYIHDYIDDRSNGCDTKMDHCSAQEMKRLKKKVEELQKQSDIYRKQCLLQKNVLQDFKNETRKREEKVQAQTKAMKESLERLKEENSQLNKRRLTEGSGFRSEIKLLRDQLHRTQRQLCYLTVKKFDD